MPRERLPMRKIHDVLRLHAVGSDLGTVELKLESAVKIQHQNPLFRFTHRVSHINTPNTVTGAKVRATLSF